MNIPDIEGLQLVSPASHQPPSPPLSSKQSQNSTPCAAQPLTELTRINELDDEGITPTQFNYPLKHDDSAQAFIYDVPPRNLSRSNSPDSDGSRTRFFHIRPATADISLLSRYPDRFTSTTGKHHENVQQSDYKNSVEVTQLYSTPIASGTGRARSHSETNISAHSLISPIIIRTSCMTKENSAEIVHPQCNSPHTVEHLVNLMNERGFSSSLGDLSTASYRIAFQAAAVSNNNDVPGAPSSTTAAGVDHNFSRLRTASGHVAVCGGFKHGGGVVTPDICRWVDPTFLIRANVPTPGVATTRVIIPRAVDGGGGGGGGGGGAGRDCACANHMCSCYKKYALSAVNLPSIPKSRKTPGLDEISYDFMRATGAISGRSKGNFFYNGREQIIPCFLFKRLFEILLWSHND